MCNTREGYRMERRSPQFGGKCAAWSKRRKRGQPLFLPKNLKLKRSYTLLERGKKRAYVSKFDFNDVGFPALFTRRV